MHLLPSLIQFLRDLRMQKLRAFLALLGITWGTVAVVLLLAFGMGLHGKFRKQFHGMGDGIAVGWPMTTTRAYRGIGRGRQLWFRAEDLLILKKEIPELEALCPEIHVWGEEIRYARKIRNIQVSGVYPVYGELRYMYPQDGGRFIDDMDVKGRRRVIFIGDLLKEELFGAEEAVGKRVFLRNTPFTVVGVLRDKEQTSSYEGGYDEARAFVPITTLSVVFGHQYVDDFIFRAGDPRRQKEVTRQIYNVLARMFRFDPEDTSAIYLMDSTEVNEILFYFFAGFNALLGVGGVFTLFVGGIGVANIMYLIVRGRTKEIGIQMAVGAKSRHILQQFLFHAFFIVFVGGALGFFISWAVTFLVALTPATEYIGYPEISPVIAAVTVTLLGIVGFLAGYFPARQAATMDPVQALGYGGE